MPETTASDLRYPIGSFSFPAQLDAAGRRSALDSIRACPARLRDAVQGLTDSQLDTPHRPGGWTLRTVAHHLPDSHLNAYTRFKLAMTEESPTIRPYDQELWAKLADSKLPVAPSVGFLEGLHVRWMGLLDSFSETDWSRTLQHPESGTLRLDQMLALYGWHSRHHVAQITAARERNGW